MRSRGNRITARSLVRSGATLVAATIAAATLTGAGPATAGTTRRPIAEQASTTTPVVTLQLGVLVARYGFEQRAGSFLDLSGHGHTLRRLSRNGGTVRTVVHGSGQALAFPRKCVGGSCPRVVLQAPDAPDLSPGTRALAYGAAVKLARNQTTKGQNVIQKGYSATGSQYKLQIDGAAGRPSCVLVDRRSPTIRIARSSRTVADGTWHNVQCRRVRSRLSILVDGAVRGAAWVPGTLSVVNSRPLSVGGKGVYRDNDQFQGAVDDVFVKVG